jgi:uncharacterized protein (TIGR02391 family)
MSNPTTLLQEQIARAEGLFGHTSSSPRYKIWRDTTIRILRENFTSEYVDLFSKADTITLVRSEAEAQRAFAKRLDEQVELLQAIIVEYNRFHDNPAVDISRAALLQTYDLHQEIKAVSLKLYEDGHYAQAIEEALKRVIKEVKSIVQNKTGQEYLKADDLMNRAFSPQNPIISFNQLQTIEDKDEQQGIMFLFKGIVGIRNKKAHDNVIQNDPVRATEYLSLASLLMRLLDQYAK